MALHHDLPIYKTGCQLVALAVKVQQHMPRGVKRSLGDKISQHCIDMLNHMAMANATQQAERATHIAQLLTVQRTLQVLLRVSHDAAYVSHALWAESVQLLDSIGRQGGGWLKKSHTRKAPAA